MKKGPALRSSRALAGEEAESAAHGQQIQPLSLEAEKEGPFLSAPFSCRQRSAARSASPWARTSYAPCGLPARSVLRFLCPTLSFFSLSLKLQTESPKELKL